MSVDKLCFINTANLTDEERQNISNVLHDIGRRLGVIFVFAEKNIQFMDRNETIEFFEHCVKKLKEKG